MISPHPPINLQKYCNPPTFHLEQSVKDLSNLKSSGVIK